MIAIRPALFAAAGLIALAACAPKEPAATATPTASATPETSCTSAPAAPTFAGLTDLSPPIEVHKALIIPGSDILFAAESADAPTTEEGWKKLQDAAQHVIDGATLMKAGCRPQGRAEWTAAADTVIAATTKTAEALAKKDTSEMVFTDGDMMTGCTACHQQFRQAPPATETPH